MNLQLKVIGLGVAVAFAFSAAAAPGALAQQGLLTSGVPVTLTGTETGGAGSNELTAFGSKFTCPGSTFTGHKFNVTPHEPIPSGAVTITLTPHYSQDKCLAQGKWRMTYDINGCDYVLHVGQTTGGVAGTYGATFDVVCAAGKEMTITMFTDELRHLASEPFCVIHIKSQTGLPGLHLTDTGNGHVDIIGAVEKIQMKRASPSGHGVLCPTQETNEGKRDLDLTVAGRGAGGEVVGIGISKQMAPFINR